MIFKLNESQQVDEYKFLEEWLIPLGYTMIFSNNIEFHYIKDGIRVIITREVQNGLHCHLHSDILGKKFNNSLISSRFAIGQDFTSILEEFKKLLKIIKIYNTPKGIRDMKLKELGI